MIVVGIDPGLANIGIGVVKEEARTPKLLAAQLVRTTPDQKQEMRLQLIYDAVRAALVLHQANALAVESQFFRQHAGQAFNIGQAVGVILLAAAHSGVPVFEYGPMNVKQTLVGTGGASKEQVMYMVRHLLALPSLPDSTHSADALALALTHLATRRVSVLGQKTLAQNILAEEILQSKKTSQLKRNPLKR